MSRLLVAIEAQSAAADGLIQACTRRQFIAPDEEQLSPTVLPFRRAFRAPLISPLDMLQTLGKLK